MALEGSTIRLREIRSADLDYLVSLRNDLETQAWSRTLPPDTTRQMYERRYLDRTFSIHRDSAAFAIAELGSDDIVGYAAYSDLHDRHEANIGVAVDRDHEGTGVAFEASELLLEFLFVRLGLAVVRLWTTSDNPRAVALAERLGFSVGIRLRQGIFKAGVFADNLQMDLLREEWFERRTDLTDGMA